MPSRVVRTRTRRNDEAAINVARLSSQVKCDCAVRCGACRLRVRRRKRETAAEPTLSLVLPHFVSFSLCTLSLSLSLEHALYCHKHGNSQLNQIVESVSRPTVENDISRSLDRPRAPLPRSRQDIFFFILLLTFSISEREPPFPSSCCVPLKDL